MSDRLSNIKFLNKRLHLLFSYKTDIEEHGVLEDWRSLYETFAAGKYFEDDCDGFAFTAADALINEELAYPAEVSVIRCLTENGRSRRPTSNYNHMVCGVNVDGTTWIIDNRHSELLLMDELTESGYKWYDFMEYNDKGNWYKIRQD